VIWVSAACDMEFVRAAFGVESLDQLAGDVPTLETPENEIVRRKCQECWEVSRRYVPVIVIAQGDPRESVLSGILVDSQPANPVASLDVWIRELKQL